MAIFDCFPFFNELDILDIRLNTLYDHVDKFIIVEAKKSHQNKDKPLYFLDNSKRFEKFLDKIHHVIIDAFPQNSYWGPENYQRNAIASEILKVCSDDDIVFVSDADEIWNPEKINPVLENMSDSAIYRVMSRVAYFYLNLMCPESGEWNTPIFTKVSYLRNLLNSGQIFSNGSSGIFRGNTGYNEIICERYSGWHFSYTEDPVQKVQNFVHSEYAHLSKEYFDECIRTLTCPFRRTPTMYIEENLQEYLPKYVMENMDKFERLILKAK